MENIDEDIKIVEEWLKNRKETIDVCGIAMSDIFVSRTFALENLLSRLKTAERMSDVLAEKICELDVDCTCDNFLPKDWKCMEYRTCKECIKEWARKKIENEKRKRKKYQHKYYLEVTKKKRQEKRNQTKAKESE